jgi:hypothetical protein
MPRRSRDRGRRPSSIYISGDGGDIVTRLSWDWTASHATGEGTSNIQNCIPNCAAGTDTPVPTSIVPLDPTKRILHQACRTAKRPDRSLYYTPGQRRVVDRPARSAQITLPPSVGKVAHRICASGTSGGRTGMYVVPRPHNPRLAVQAICLASGHGYAAVASPAAGSHVVPRPAGVIELSPKRVGCVRRTRKAIVQLGGRSPHEFSFARLRSD